MKNKKYFIFKLLLFISFVLLLISIYMKYLFYTIKDIQYQNAVYLFVLVSIFFLFLAGLYGEMIEKTIILKPEIFSLKDTNLKNYSKTIIHKLIKLNYKPFKIKEKNFSIYYRSEQRRAFRGGYYDLHVIYIILNVEKINKVDIKRYEEKINKIIYENFKGGVAVNTNISLIFFVKRYSNFIKNGYNLKLHNISSKIVSYVAIDTQKIYVSKMLDFMFNGKLHYNCLRKELLNLFELEQ